MLDWHDDRFDIKGNFSRTVLKFLFIIFVICLTVTCIVYIDYKFHGLEESAKYRYDDILDEYYSLM